VELKELRLLFESGALKEAHICELFGEWTLECTRPGRETAVMTTSRRGEIRRFKSLDAAFAAAQAVGFRRATVTVSAAD